MAASCPLWPADCSWNDFSADIDNPYVLYGALVGGPTDQNESYNDARDDYVANEVTTDYNAGFQGVVAALKMKDVIGVSQTAVLRKRSFNLLEDEVYEKEFPTIPKNFSPKKVKKPKTKVSPKFKFFY